MEEKCNNAKGRPELIELMSALINLSDERDGLICDINSKLDKLKLNRNPKDADVKDSSFSEIFVEDLRLVVHKFSKANAELNQIHQRISEII